MTGPFDSENEESGVFDEETSGPFCRHYGDPASCEILCARAGCRHGCTSHDALVSADGGYGCMVEVPVCDCQDWMEPEE